MLHKACGALAAIGAPGAIAFMIAALEQRPSSATTNWLWVGAGICLAVALAGTFGWLLTREGIMAGNMNIAGRDAYQAGRDINVQPPPEHPSIPWISRAGGPQFRMSPTVDHGKLLCQFRISNASPAPGGVEARWLGAGTDMDSTAPMLGNVPAGASYQTYQMKPTEMAPKPPDDQVTFEVRFNLEDGPHYGRWIWPLRQHESKGHWILDSHLGSGVLQPRREDAT